MSALKVLTTQFRLRSCGITVPCTRFSGHEFQRRQEDIPVNSNGGQCSMRARIATGTSGACRWELQQVPTGYAYPNSDGRETGMWAGISKGHQRGTRAGIVTYESEFQWGATQHVDKNCSGRQGVMRVRIAPGNSGVCSRKLQRASTRSADGICNATRYLGADPTGVKGHVVAHRRELQNSPKGRIPIPARWNSKVSVHPVVNQIGFYRGMCLLNPSVRAWMLY